ncbi:unnamed protein product, partial [Didymodactylos carnosus]
MIDTGATNTLITQQALPSTRHKKYLSNYSWKLYQADGQTPLEVLGVVPLQIKINSTTTDISAYVVKRLCAPCLLGQDYINKYQMKIDAGSQTITIIQNKITTTTNIIKHQCPFHLINSTAETSIDNLLHHRKDDVQRSTLKQTFLPYAKIFDISKPTIANTMIKHAINTIEHPPPCSKSYQFSYEKRDALYNIVRSLIESGHVRESNSSYASPAILVEKKDKSWRLVIDYKKLNAITIKDEFPLPNMEDTLQEVGNGFAFFSKLDLKSGFWQLPIDPKDRHKTAFKTPFGLFEWNVLPQGLKNSPPTFQRVMTKLLEPCRKNCLVYIDDLIIFSKTFEEHVQHLNQVLSLLHQSNFQLNPAKCQIARNEINYLGHHINQSGISPLPEKISSIVQLKANKFVGALSWYRKFIPQFATTAAPIHAVTNLPKNLRYKFKWEPEQSTSFHELKKLLTEAPLFLNFSVDKHPIILTTDASLIGITGILQQEIHEEMHNLYYHSQLINSTQRRYDTGAKEALAIVLSIKRMRQYLLGRDIIIYTDYYPLCGMQNKTLRNTLANRISILLQEYNIIQIIPYSRKEKLSTGLLQTRRAQQEQTTETSPNDSTSDQDSIDLNSNQKFNCNKFDIRQLKIEQDKESTIKLKIDQLKKDPNKIDFVLKDDILYKLVQPKYSICKKPVPYIPPSMIALLLEASHNDPLSGHFATHGTLAKLKHQFWWPDIKSSVEKYIKSCSKCQQFNISKKKKPGYLKTISSPDGPFQITAIDYVGPLNRSPSENRYVLAITDLFTRWITAVALPSSTTAVTAEAIFKHYICHYGVPVTILSDHGSHFRNQLLQALERKIGIHHIFSSPYHPQSNGMIERFNAIFIPQIAKLQDSEYNNWDEFLDPVVFAYNTGVHSSTKFSPYEL